MFCKRGCFLAVGYFLFLMVLVQSFEFAEIYSADGVNAINPASHL